MWKQFALALLLTALSGAAAAESGLRALETGDDARGWTGVGRLNIGTNTFCTGALISEDTVLTAAHCLYDKETGRRFDASEIEFLADWRNGRASAVRGISIALPHPGFGFSNQATTDRVSHDVALLRLDAPIRNSTVTPFGVRFGTQRGEEVGVVSYGLGREDSPSLQEVCHVLARQGGSLVLSCQVEFGSSGSPIFVMENGRPQIVSVVSAKAQVSGSPVSLGTSLEAPLSDLMQLMQVEGERFASAGNVNRLADPETGITPSGAKFLRP
ncbi:trypsin-like serine peptidase [Anianabacter salinae]|uniref:trypsin-like serine peptidase n=1 Tax=Anianabacter salinae TaxID=2851023 RepID=UPI00225E52E7|nr:trypsin-like serine protease [Anianabacter salinae]MBV0913075.1 trypsin-like serine protease [Anianabacter salinae]